MPRRLPKRLLSRDGEIEWWVERLQRRDCQHGVPTDARLASTRKGKEHATYNLAYSDSDLTYSTRRDLVTYRLPVAPVVYWHRAVAFAWHGPRGEYEDVGGVWRRFPRKLTWAHFANYEVDHGAGGADSVLIDSLTICTAERNQELEQEREQAKRDAKARAKLLLERRMEKRKAKKRKCE